MSRHSILIRRWRIFHHLTIAFPSNKKISRDRFWPVSLIARPAYCRYRTGNLSEKGVLPKDSPEGGALDSSLQRAHESRFSRFILRLVCSRVARALIVRRARDASSPMNPPMRRRLIVVEMRGKIPQNEQLPFEPPPDPPFPPLDPLGAAWFT